MPYLTEVIGVTNGDAAVAVPIDHVCGQQVVDFDLGDDALVAVCDQMSGIHGVFNRTQSDRTLTLAVAQIDSATRLRDTESGQVWDMGGRALGDQPDLASFPHSSRIFWFSWANFNPQTELIGA